MPAKGRSTRHREARITRLVKVALGLRTKFWCRYVSTKLWASRGPLHSERRDSAERAAPPELMDERLHIPEKTAIPFGPLPTGMVSTTAWLAVSITETSSSLMLVT